MKQVRTMSSYTSLEDAYGSSFGTRIPITQSSGAGPQQGPVGMSLEEKSKASMQANKGIVDALMKTLPFDTNKETENFEPRKVQQVALPGHTLRQQSGPVSTIKEGFGVPVGGDVDIAARLDRILRLIEQNRTGYESASTQDMLLYIFTGVFFLFTFDSFVQLGKSMKR